MDIIVTTTESIPGREVDAILGVVRGNTVRAKHIGKDILASLKTLIGGEIRVYVEAMNEAREESTQRMVAEARALGADAIIGVRYTTSQVMEGAAELLAYGTAVKLR